MGLGQLIEGERTGLDEGFHEDTGLLSQSGRQGVTSRLVSVPWEMEQHVTGAEDGWGAPSSLLSAGGWMGSLHR